MLHAGSSFSSILHAALALAGSSTSRVHHLVVRTARHRTGTTASLPTPPPLSSDLETSKDAAAAARDWLMRFKGCPIPRAAVEIAFSRSSGPGGQVCSVICLPSLFVLFVCNLYVAIKNNFWRDGQQNVNKVNTKATVRCALDSTWIPSWARDALQQSVCSGVCSPDGFFLFLPRVC